MRLLNAAELRRALPMSEAIQAMRLAFSDDVEVPRRSLLANSLFMPGRAGSYTGMKVVSTAPGDPAGLVAVFGEDGHPLGIVDGPTLTSLRTAAGAGLATDLLARSDARVMAMLGAGSMAADQVEAVRAVRSIERVVVWSRTRERAQDLAERVRGEAAADADAAVAEADVVTTATPAHSPLFRAASLRPGTHLNAIGAFRPEMVEVPPEVVRAARVFVDDRSAAAEEAGDLIQAGRVPDGTLADLLAGRSEGRTGPDEVTLFKSVGIASQDVAAAAWALQGAELSGLGSVLG